MESSKKRKSYDSKSIQYKRAIILEIQRGTKINFISQREKLSQSTVSTWWKNREKILSASCNDDSAASSNPEKKRIGKIEKQSVDEALHLWFQQMRSSNVPVNGPLLLSKANHFAERLEVNPVDRSWIDRWKSRHAIVSQRVVGESASVSMEMVTDWKDTKLKALLEKFQPSDVYNMDETGLFYKMIPSTTLHYKGQKCEGGKQSKERLTLALCANMDGSDKLPLLAIGKSAKPRCFKNIATLPVRCESNRKA